MKKLSWLAVILVLVGAAGWGQNTVGTGQWLHEFWLSSQKVDSTSNPGWPDVTGQGKYIVFVAGSANVMADADWLNMGNTTWGQWCAVVGKYLDANPEQWNLEAQILVYRALYVAWPGSKDPPYGYKQ